VASSELFRAAPSLAACEGYEGPWVASKRVTPYVTLSGVTGEECPVLSALFGGPHIPRKHRNVSRRSATPEIRVREAKNKT